MSSISAALSYDIKAQIARDLSLNAPTIDDQTALVDALPVNIIERYFLVNIFKSHILYDVHGHKIIIPKRLLNTVKELFGTPYDYDDIEHFTYIAADADFENCEFDDDDLSYRVEAVINKNIEGRRNGLF